MYLECRGLGSPTVVLVAGLRGSAEDKNIAATPCIGPLGIRDGGERHHIATAGCRRSERNVVHAAP